MCLRPTEYHYSALHHEMGHIYSMMFYWDKPYLMRNTANPGFNEAIGNTLGLSSSSPVHLKKMGFLETDSISKGKPIAYEMFVGMLAVQKLNFCHRSKKVVLIECYKGQATDLKSGLF